MKIKLVAALAISAMALASHASVAQETKAGTPETVALVSAVGSQFNFSRESRSVGSNIVDPTRRVNFKVPSNALDMAVLRGLDAALDITAPSSEREFIVLRLPEDEGRKGSDREKESFKGLVAQLKDYPGRAKWDKIVAVIPAYQMTTGKNMGSKLHGVGLYVQPLARQKISIGDDLQSSSGNITVESAAEDGDETTYAPDGSRARSSVFVAPYFYTRTITLDAKTRLRCSKTSAICPIASCLIRIPRRWMCSFK
jgi:hypothetical protein